MSALNRILFLQAKTKMDHWRLRAWIEEKDLKHYLLI